MAVILPFKGLLYNQREIGDLYRVVAPPYDVITEKEREILSKRDPYNVVRLILSRDDPDSGKDRYQMAGEVLNRWIDQGILIRDEAPAFYYYQQTYKLKSGTAKTRRGFISLVRLEEFGAGVILPHERTLLKPKADRLNLLKACNAHFSSVFSLYSDQKGKIDKILLEKRGAPIIEVTDDKGIENRLWRVEDKGVLSEVVREMSGKSLLIADGHHRYETALEYRDLMRAKYPDYKGDEAFNYVMVYLSNMDDEGLTILPTHRLIHGLEGFSPRSFLSKLSGFFDIDEVTFNGRSEAQGRESFLKLLKEKVKEKLSFGLYIKGIKTYFVLTLKDLQIMDQWIDGDTSSELKTLDLTVLHTIIVRGIMKIDEGNQQECIDYVKDADEVIESVRRDKYQMAFILNPPEIGKIKAIATAGEKMPQKSTYFYPKLLTGLVMNLI